MFVFLSFWLEAITLPYLSYGLFYTWLFIVIGEATAEIGEVEGCQSLYKMN